MKNKVFTLLLCFVASVSFAQELEIKEKKETSFLPVVEIEIDLNQFIEKTKNNYWEKEGEGFIHKGIRLVKYEEMKDHMSKNDGGLIRIVEEKEIYLNGISYLYFKQEQNRAGQMFEIISYVKKHDENSVIEVGVVYPKGEEKKYKNIIENAAISAKVIE